MTQDVPHDAAPAQQRGAARKPARKEPEFDAEEVRNISERVYAMRLGKDAAKMLAEVGTEKFRARAGAYDDLTRDYMRAMRQ